METPSMKLNIDGGREFEATPENTSLFRFMGNLAIYNHVFMVTDPEESKGVYVFAVHQVYPQMEEYMIQAEYPLHDHLRSVAECDIVAYDRMIHQHAADLDGGVPEDWQ